MDSPGHIYYRYVVKSHLAPGELIARLEGEGVAARQPVYNPLHREIGRPDSAYPGATAAHAADVSLPLYPALDAGEVQKDIGAVRTVATND